MGFRSHTVPQLNQEHAQASAIGIGSVWPSASRALFRFGLGTAAQITRYEAASVSVVALGYVLLEFARAVRPLWFDEIFTFQIACLPDLGSILHAIPADGNPPLYYLLTRLSFRLLGQTAFAARFPSILAFTAALFATYYFVRRRCGPVFGMFAMLALSCTYMSTTYGSEARPYAFLAGFTGLTMVSWQAATEAKQNRLFPLIGMALGTAGAIASHHYGVIHVGVPLMFGEAVRLLKRRRLDVPLYVAGAAGLSALAVTLPLAVATRRLLLTYVKRSASFWAKPTLADLFSYRSFTCVWILLVFLAFLYLTHAASYLGDEPRQSADEQAGPPAHEIAAALGLALLVPIMVGVTWLTTGYYMDRYAIGAAIGIAMLIGFASSSLGRNRRQAMAVAALCTILLAGRLTGAGARQAITLRMAKGPSVSLADDTFLGTVPGSELIVMAGAMEFGEDWFYAPPSLRERLHYLSDLSYAVRQSDFLSELSLIADQAYVLPKVDDYRKFVSAHDRFYVYDAGIPEQEWIMNRLLSEGWTLKVVGISGDTRLYLAQNLGR